MITKTCQRCFELVPKDLFGEHLASACIALGGTSGALNLVRKKTSVAKPTISHVLDSSAVYKNSMRDYKLQERPRYKPIYCRRCEDFTTHFQREFEQHEQVCSTKKFVFCPCCNVPIEERLIAVHIKSRIRDFYAFLLSNLFIIPIKGYLRCCSCLCLVQSEQTQPHSCPFHLKAPPSTTHSSRSIKCPECFKPVTWKKLFHHVEHEHRDSLRGISKTNLKNRATFPYVLFNEPVPKSIAGLKKCPHCACKPKNLDKHLLKCPFLKEKKESKYQGLPRPSYGKAQDVVYLDGSRGYDHFRDSSGRFHSYSSFDDYGEDGMP